LVGTSPHLPKKRSDGSEYIALDAGSRQDVVVVEIVDMRQHIFRDETRQVLTRFLIVIELVQLWCRYPKKEHTSCHRSRPWSL
jgi:hypothetical protein